MTHRRDWTSQEQRAQILQIAKYARDSARDACKTARATVTRARAARQQSRQVLVTARTNGALAKDSSAPSRRSDLVVRLGYSLS